MHKRKQDYGRVRYDEASYRLSDLGNGVHAFFVAARCRQLTDRQEIAMLWWLQQISWREGGMLKFAADFLEKNDARVARFDFDSSFFLDSPAKPDIRPFLSPAPFAEVLTRAMVDASAPSLRDGTSGFDDLWTSLVQWRDAEISASTSKIVETVVSRMVFDELDFANETRSFVLIEGREGIGKTEAAKLWCRQRPGRAVYIRLESSTDEASLYRSIAREIGSPHQYARSVFDMRARIQDALQPGHLMLVIDEAHFLWPQSKSVRVPRRVDWLRTALIDFDVPVALISTPQFFTDQCQRFRNAGWNSNQIERRLSRLVLLPESLPAQDARAVARSYFPGVSAEQLKRLAFAALATTGYLTTLAHTKKRVEFLKPRLPEMSEADVIEAVLAELVLLPGVVLPAAKKASAEPVQAPCRDAAKPISETLPRSRIGVLNAQLSKVSAV